MARRSSVAYRAAQRQRELERQARARQREQMASAREAERARQAYERAQVLEEKERKRLYVEARVAEAAAQNADLGSVNTSLEELLRDALEVHDYLDGMPWV